MRTRCCANGTATASALSQPRLGGRLAAQDPCAVGAALDRPAGHQLAERGGDGGPARADHAGQRAVRQAQRDEHAAGHDAAPALGEQPQQREQAVVDAGQVGDRLGDHEPLGAARGAVHQRGEDLRPLRHPHGERLVDDRHARARRGRPVDAARQQLLGVVVVAGAQQVARAEQLGARVVARRSPRARAGPRARAARSAGCRRSATAAASSARAARRSRACRGAPRPRAPAGRQARVPGRGRPSEVERSLSSRHAFWGCPFPPPTTR